MNTIWKYALEITDEQVIKAPAGARFLTAQFQNDQLCLWAEVSPSAELVKRRILVYGTGNPISVLDKAWIATVQMLGGALVWHIFEAAV